MADQYAAIDQNRIPAMLGHSGTSGTAETRRIVADDNGNMLVAGTVTTTMGDLSGGTIDQITNGSIVVTAGTVETTSTDIPGGTIDEITTGSLANIAMLHAGTVEISGISGDLAGGTIDQITAGTIDINNNNLVSTNNSTTNTLPAGGTWTGTGDDLDGYSAVTCTLFSSHDSAVDGMQFQFSTDNTNWDDVYSFTMDVSSSAARRFQFPVTARYFRHNYINGAGSQTAFRVQTILHRQNQLTSIHRLVDDMSPDRSAQVVKGALFAAVNGTGDFQAIQANSAGILKIGGAVEVDTITADIPGGTIDSVTTVSNLTNGSVAVTAGTISALNADIPGGTVDVVSAINTLPDLPGGTIDSLTTGSLSNVAMLHAGTVEVSAIAGDLAGGTIDEVTLLKAGTLEDVTVTAFTADIPGGTIDNVSTIPGVGVVTNITNLPDLPGGTIDSLTTGSIANLSMIHAGTVEVSTLPDLPGGTVDLVTTVSNLTNGSVAVTAGTVSAFTADIPGGTIDNITNVDAGTIQINPKSTQIMKTYGTRVTATTQFSLVAAPGAGTATYINDISVVNSGTATNGIQIGFGTADLQGATQILRGIFAANGGIQKSYPIAVTGNQTNLALQGSLNSAGTFDINLTYWTE